MIQLIGSDTITFSTPGDPVGDYFVTSDGVKGWYSTPDSAVQLRSRTEGDGAFPIQDDDIRFSARTVTVNFAYRGENRDGLVSMMHRLNGMAHEIVVVRLVDSVDTFCSGYMVVDEPATYSAQAQTGTFTVVCPDPRRYSWNERDFFLSPNAAGRGGLSYGPDNKGLVYPLSYGQQATDARNVCTLTNAGSAPACPRFEVHGGFDSIVLETSLGTIRYSQPVGVEPLVLDCLHRTASVGGLDRSQFLTERGFPQIPPGGSVSVSLQSSGTGWVVASVRDTFI